MDKDELYKQAKEIIKEILKKYDVKKRNIILLSFVLRIIHNQPDKLIWFLEQEKASQKFLDLFDLFNFDNLS